MDRLPLTTQEPIEGTLFRSYLIKGITHSRRPSGQATGPSVLPASSRFSSAKAAGHSYRVHASRDACGRCRDQMLFRFRRTARCLCRDAFDTVMRSDAKTAICRSICVAHRGSLRRTPLRPGFDNAALLTRSVAPSARQRCTPKVLRAHHHRAFIAPERASPRPRARSDSRHKPTARGLRGVPVSMA